MQAAQAYREGLRLSSQGRHGEAIAAYETALAADPGDINVLFALGNTAQALNMPAPAEAFFRQVLAIAPERVEALVNLANLLRQTGQFDAAITLLEPALAQGPDPDLLTTLGSAWREKGEAAKAMDAYRAALALAPNHVAALSNLADMLCDTHAWDEAKALYDRAIKTDPTNAQARLNRAVLHLLKGELKEGWRDYDARLGLPSKVPAASRKFTAWTGGSLTRARLLVRAEQGVGDHVLFASLIPDLAARAREEGGTVLVECDPRLVPLFARSFPDVTVHGLDLRMRDGVAVADYGWLAKEGGASLAIAMGSLPRYLRPGLERFPSPHAFLAPDAAEAAHWRARLGSDAIGLCWRSGKSGGHRSIQYAPLEQWAGFIRDLPGTPVCAQYDASPEEIARLEAMSGRTILVPPDLDQKNELDRTAAMLSACKALVSAPTAVAWLGAGVGTPTFKALYDTSWTALGQTYEPFAPACRCVMPAHPGDWADVFGQVLKAL